MRKLAKWITALLLIASGAAVVILTILSHIDGIEKVLPILIGLVALGIGSQILTEEDEL